MIVHQELDAFLARALFQRAHQAGAAGSGWAFQALPFAPDRVVLTEGRNADGVRTAVIRGLIDKFYAVLDQELVGGGFIVGQRPLHAAVIEAIFGHAADFDDRPVRQVTEEHVG